MVHTVISALARQREEDCEFQASYNESSKNQGLRHSSVAEYLPTVHRGLRLVLSTGEEGN